MSWNNRTARSKVIKRKVKKSKIFVCGQTYAEHQINLDSRVSTTCHILSSSSLSQRWCHALNSPSSRRRAGSSKSNNCVSWEVHTAACKCQGHHEYSYGNSLYITCNSNVCCLGQRCQYPPLILSSTASIWGGKYKQDGGAFLVNKLLLGHTSTYCLLWECKCGIHPYFNEECAWHPQDGMQVLGPAVHFDSDDGLKSVVTCYLSIPTSLGEGGAPCFLLSLVTV
jgi:hypothetical protein